jgi:NADPH-dependent ferric siderophore reductase
MPNNGRPRYSAFERAQLKVLTKAAAMVMAPAATRAVYEQFTMTVHEATYLHPKLRRITFRAPEFTGFVPTGPDEYFGLLMAPPGRGLTMPSVDRFNVRQAIRKLPEEQRPDLRWYTIRALRPATGEIDVDFVLHGDAGPGSRWASAAEPGDEAGFRAGNATYQPPAASGEHLLAADETALPALSAILEAHGAGPARLRAFVELPDDTYRVPADSPVDITWLHRGDGEPGSALLPTIRDAALSTPDYAWLCGESAIATGLRRHLVRDREVDRRRIMFSGYWKLGQARM